MNYWIFVATEYSDFQRGGTNAILSTLIKDKRWSIGYHTGFRKKLKKDDQILLYLSGKNNMKFFASGILDSECVCESKFYSYVSIRNIKIFKKEIFIKPIIKKLKFIKNKKYWGLYMQNGIVKISKRDYNTIIH